HSLCVLLGKPAEMGSMDEFDDTGVDGSHHRLRADCMYLDPHVDLLGFVDDCFEIFEFLGGGSGLGSERHLPNKFNSSGSERPHFSARLFEGVVGQFNASGWD